MTTLLHLTLIYVLLMLKDVTAKPGAVNTDPRDILQTKSFRNSENGMMGVASVAGIVSRNGRVSSMGGVKFFPATDEKKNTNSNSMQPWTFSKKSDDGFTVGAVQVYPGSVVSSVSSFGDSKSNLGDINPFVNFPIQNSFFPRSIFTPRTNLNPLSPKGMFKSYDPMTPDFENMWHYPIYDPFLNVWL